MATVSRGRTAPGAAPRMPSRVRLVRVELLSDAAFGRMSAGARYLYFALSTAADDEGFLRWDAPTLAARASPFEPPRKRERAFERWATEMVAAGLLEILDCGCAVLVRLDPDLRPGSGQFVATVRRWHAEQHVGITTDNEVGISIPNLRDGTYRDVSGRVGEEGIGSDQRAASAPLPEPSRLHPPSKRASPIARLDAFLVAQGAYLDDGHPLRPPIVELAAQHGEDRVLEAMRTATDGRYAATALRALRPSKADRQAAGEAVANDRHRREVEATKRRAHALTWHDEEPDVGCPDCRVVASAGSP